MVPPSFSDIVASISPMGSSTTRWTAANSAPAAYHGIFIDLASSNTLSDALAMMIALGVQYGMLGLHDGVANDDRAVVPHFLS